MTYATTVGGCFNPKVIIPRQRLYPTQADSDGRTLRMKSSDPLFKPEDKHAMSLDRAVAMWPTPRKEGFDAGKHKGKADSLHSAVKMMPTPRSHCRDMGTMEMSRFAGRQRAAGKDGATYDPANGGQLNPTWVEWLMGFPLGHTDSKDWAMQLSRKSRSSSAKRSTKLKTLNNFAKETLVNPKPKGNNHVADRQAHNTKDNK